MMVATNKKGTNMCGIAGFSLNPKDKIRADQLCTELLLGIESRGRMATGAAWVAENGHVWYQKDDITASTFVLTMAVPRNASHVILHTRYATQGSPSDVVEGVKVNNHPIIASNPERTVTITGTHNGCLSNENEMDTLFGSLRLAEVDSEAFFAAVATNPADPIKALETVGGSAAVAWFSDTDTQPTLHLARVRTSPVEWAKTANGSFIYASTREALKTAMDKCGLVAASTGIMLPGEYHQISDGKLDTTKFKPAYSYTPTVDWDQRTTFGSYTKTPNTPAKQPAKQSEFKIIQAAVRTQKARTRTAYLEGVEDAIVTTLVDYLAETLLDNDDVTVSTGMFDEFCLAIDEAPVNGYIHALEFAVLRDEYQTLSNSNQTLSDIRTVVLTVAKGLQTAQYLHAGASHNMWPGIMARLAIRTAELVDIATADMVNIMLESGEAHTEICAQPATRTGTLVPV